MSLTITSILSEFGSYYKPGSQNLKNLRAMIFDTSSMDEMFNLIPTNATRLEGGNVDITGILQSYQDTWTPYGNTTFTGKHIDLYQLKADLQENPTKLQNSWLGFLATNKVDRKTWPFVRWWMEKLVMPRMRQDWQLNGIFWGTAGAITPGTANPVLTGVLGFRKQINDAITATTISPIVLGAMPTANTSAGYIATVDYVEAFALSIPTKYRPFLKPIAMANTQFDRYKKGMRAKYNMNYEQAAELSTIMDFDIPVKGFSAMDGSTKIWTTIEGNTELGVKGPENENMFEIESIDRLVKIFTDFYKGVGFYRGDFMFTNDVDLV